jgi:hypothetical protein
VTGVAATDEQFLDGLQRAAFEYFLLAVNPVNGLIADTSRPESPCSIAVVGFALSVYPIAVERGWMTRADAVDRSLRALRFFRDSDQSRSPDATGYKGFYYHFLDMQTGRRVWGCELSMIDTALLIAGALTAGRYFSTDAANEAELRQVADEMYRRIDWPWAQDDCATLRQGWKPSTGFLHYGWEGYNEAIVMQLLGLGSPTYPLNADVYETWTATYQWENMYGHDVLYAGPLFIHQYSHAWVDFRGIRDRFMREKRCDYFENSRRATLVQREYARRNPKGFAGYDEQCWGYSACDGPGHRTPSGTKALHQFFGYAARGAPFGPDDGTLSGASTLASLPFAPELALRAARCMIERYPEMLPANRFASAFNPTFGDPGGSPAAWVSRGHFGLDQGIVVMMIENYRTGLIWRLMRECGYLVEGLRQAGFRGGWL